MKRWIWSLVLFATAAYAQSDSPFWAAAQINVIDQRHGAFDSPYSGPNSMRSNAEHATSHVETIYSGFVISPHHELLADFESAGGRGISDALGLAGFTNLDVVRNPDLGPAPYVARLMYHGVFALSADEEKQERTFTSVLTKIPTRRLEVRAGKMSVVDFFDVNNAGSDSHLQFMNWTVDNNGAFDYAADTRGYTIGVMAEYDDRDWSLRAGAFEMPTVANGIKYDGHLRSARGQQIELERRWRRTTARFLVFDNRARMGNYRQSIALGTPPDITATRRPGRAKFGAGLNGEHSLTDAVRIFGRAGWNDGRNESFAYTEVDRTFEVGGDARIGHRSGDKAGVALVVNAISDAHRDYLDAGGMGFLLGDGRLRYGHETIVETYYTARIIRGLYASIDVQRIANPGYNRDRGPVWVPGARVHVDF